MKNNTCVMYATSVHLQTHPVMDLIVCQSDVIFVYCIPSNDSTEIVIKSVDGVVWWWSEYDSPFLELNLWRISTCLRGDELLQISNRIIWAAFHSHYKFRRKMSGRSDVGKFTEYRRAHMVDIPLRPSRSLAITYRSLSFCMFQAVCSTNLYQCHVTEEMFYRK